MIIMMMMMINHDHNDEDDQDWKPGCFPGRRRRHHRGPRLSRRLQHQAHARRSTSVFLFCSKYSRRSPPGVSKSLGSSCPWLNHIFHFYQDFCSGVSDLCLGHHQEQNVRRVYIKQWKRSWRLFLLLNGKFKSRDCGNCQVWQHFV